MLKNKNVFSCITLFSEKKSIEKIGHPGHKLLYNDGTGTDMH